MMNKKLSIFIGIILIILIISLFFLNNSFGVISENKVDNLEKVRVGNLPVAHGLPVYLAYEKGYFEQAGIDVEIIKMESPNQIIDALIQGQIDMTTPSGAAGVSAVADFKNPGKLKIYALSGGDLKNPATAVVVPNNSSVNSMGELEGKTFGIMGGSLQWRLLGRHVLEEYGYIADKDVTLVEVPISSHITAIASGQVDAILTIEPIITLVEKQKIGKVIVDAPIGKTLADPFYPGAGIISTKFLKERPEVAKKVMEIIEKANNEIDARPNEARQYLKGYTSLNEELINEIPLVLIKTCEDITQKDIEGLQNFYDLFSKYDVIDGQINAKEIMYCN
jgi:NitT/TauT family transport system substrate-binding protein